MIVVQALVTAKLCNTFTLNFDTLHPDGEKSQMFFNFTV